MELNIKWGFFWSAQSNPSFINFSRLTEEIKRLNMSAFFFKETTIMFLQEYECQTKPKLKVKKKIN